MPTKPVGQLMVKMCAEEEFVWPWPDQEPEVEVVEVSTPAWGVISAENEVISVEIAPTPSMATKDLQVQGSAADPEVAVEDLDEAGPAIEEIEADPEEEDTNIRKHLYGGLWIAVLICLEIFRFVLFI